ncbi:hypothetical protein [Halorarius halobius]|uniref:hypothetical protein n=1 Tax=Halorarius halobius TaxID=2962671 RepID=UPI0020CBB597|nr:hypothetical protein [Halorarius halobius]
MDHLAPANVPTYETREEGRDVWERCADRRLPVVAVRDARRGFIVRYDLQHLDRELTPRALQGMRERVRMYRTGDTDVEAHPHSQAVGLGGELGPVSGDVHEATAERARDLASRLSVTVLDRDNWR